MTHRIFVKATRPPSGTRNRAWLMLQATFVFAMLLLLTPVAWSATYYVATNGNDAASGTSLHHAVQNHTESHEHRGRR